MIGHRLIRVALLCLVACGQSASAQDVVEEPPRKTPVIYEADVVVIGGGLSGFGAGIGAARSGAKTLVIERTGYIGGWLRGTGLGNAVAVSAPGWHPDLTEGVLKDVSQRLVALDMPLHSSMEAILERGDLRITNHETIPHAFQSPLVEAGAEILYFSTYVDSIVKDGSIQAVIVETPVGRGAVRGKVFIDCTGLATVAAESGAPVKKDEAYMGLASWMRNVDAKRFWEYEKSLPEEPDPAAKPWLQRKLGHPITFFSSSSPGGMNFPWDDWLERNANVLGPKFREAVDSGEMPLFYKVGEKGIVGFVEGLKVEDFPNTGGIARPRTYIVGVDPTDVKQVSDAHVRSTEYLFKLQHFLNKNIPGFEKAELTRLADTTLNRAGRSIKNNEFDAASENTDPPAGSPVRHEDVVVVMQRGDDNAVYEVPYHAMLPEKINNLLAVGKSSAGGIKFRTHMLSIVMGQAAGTAAAVAVQDDVVPANVNIRKVQSALRKAGVPLPEKK